MCCVVFFCFLFLFHLGKYVHMHVCWRFHFYSVIILLVCFFFFLCPSSLYSLFVVPIVGRIVIWQLLVFAIYKQHSHTHSIEGDTFTHLTMKQFNKLHSETEFTHKPMQMYMCVPVCTRYESAADLHTHPCKCVSTWIDT